MSKSGKSNEVSRVKLLIAGTNKHFPNASQPLTVGGAPYTVSSLTALLQSFVDLEQAVDVARAAAKAKLDVERAQAPSLRGVVGAFVAFVKATFGNSADVLVDFGLSPRKARAPQTAEQKAVASAKRKATRAARHVMGSRQRKEVTAPVQVTVTTTPLAAPQPVAAAAPTAAAPATTGGATPPHS